MNITQIEDNLQKITQAFNKDSFIYEMILAYGQPKSSVTRLQQGGLNLSKVAGEIEWKKKLFYKAVTKEDDIHALFEKLKTFPKALKNDPRFIIVTDFETLLAFDTKTKDSLDIPILDLAKHFDFFLPWAGMEKAQVQLENPADVKAAEKMGRLYAEIKKDNPDETDVHNLNVFLSRLLFCFFAEDTGIFKPNQFTHGINSHTQPDGSDLNTYLDNLFKVMNTPPQYRHDLSAYLEAFPYVNGGLFKNQLGAPIFSRKSRTILIECGGLDWAAINPDIFGSMIQGVVTAEHRGNLGMHYTSVPNIMKVIEPLFLNDLKEEFEAAKHEPRKLNKLLDRISKIKIFDPACGSGNFLIIAYKELRLLEISILKQLQSLQHATSGFDPYQLELIPKAQLTLAAAYQPSFFSRIELTQFYGIEIDDFAHEIAILSLWLAEHQMNKQFREVIPNDIPSLPLKPSGNIMHGNATRLDWSEICSHTEGGEVFVLGNPPYLGSFLQSKEQKEDLAYVCKGFKSYKDLDFIACWFIKGTNYINKSNAQFAFVTTNSISQGEQVILLWPYIFSKKCEISFAYESFKWVNNARSNAGVYCTIIGVRNIVIGKKKIYTDDLFHIVDNINPYLSSGNSVVISKRMKPLSKIQTMSYGSKIVDNGHLIFSTEEKNELLESYPNATILFKKLAGSAEFIRGLDRWCLYISDEKLDLANSITPIAKRLELVTAFRLKSTEISTREMGDSPHRFYYSVHNDSNSIIIPRTSSERRDYIPMGFLDGNTIVSDAASVIFNAELPIFSILTSRIHMTWVRAVCGRLKTDYRYSAQLCYNTFPMPPLSKSQEKELERHVYRILEEREAHSEKTLAQLYDPDKMPDGLREAHRQNDLAVERIYRSKPFESDEERLAYLFKLYEQMIAEEKARAGELNFEMGKKKKQ